MVNVPAFLMLLTSLNIQVTFTFFKQRSYSIIPNFILSIFLKNDFNITSLKTQSLGFLICFEIIIDFQENCMFFVLFMRLKMLSVFYLWKLWIVLKAPYNPM